MKNYIFILLLSVLTLSCNNDYRPSKKMSKKEMCKLLEEIQITEAQISVARENFNYNVDSVRLYTISTYSALFEKYGITKEIFEENYKYYLSKPEVLRDITDKVDKNIKIADSIANIANSTPNQ